MIYDLFILFEIVMIVAFFIAFFTHQEIIWAVTAVLSGVLMYVSYSVEIQTYVFNATAGAYTQTLVLHSFPVLMAINMIFFVLALILGLFDAFDKYGISTMNFKLK